MIFNTIFLALIKVTHPEFLAKDSNYIVEDIVGSRMMPRYNNQVLLASLENGFSTTATISNILK